VPRAVARIGQDSLEVFCLGLFLSWGATAAFRLLPAQGAGFVAQDVLLTGAGSAVLAALRVGWNTGAGAAALRRGPD
jgi:hypothetical protein